MPRPGAAPTALPPVEGANVRGTGRAVRAPCASNRLVTLFFGADTDGFLDVGDEDLAVADLAGAGGLDDGGDGGVGLGIGDHRFDLELGQKIDGVFAAAIDLGVAL